METSMDTVRPNAARIPFQGNAGFGINAVSILKSIANPSATPLTGNVASSSTKSDLHVCTICNKSFGQKCHLTRHLKIHSGVKNYVCNICIKQFTRNTDFARHMTTHLKTTSYSCPDCNEVFHRKVSMEGHLANHLRQFVCEQCTESFSRKEHLLQHTMVRHPKKRNQPPAGPAPKRRKAEGALGVFTAKQILPSEEAAGDLVFLEEVRGQLSAMREEEVENKREIKWYCVSKIQFVRKIAEEGDCHSFLSKQD